MLAEAQVDPEVSFLLGKDINTFRDILQGLLERQRGAAHRARRRRRAARQAGRDGDGVQGVPQRRRRAILGNQQGLVNAKRATFDLFNDSEALLAAAEALNDALRGRSSPGGASTRSC